MAETVLLRSVLITDLEYLAPNGTWTPCKARDKSALPDEETTISIKWDDDETGKGIPLVDNTNPQAPKPTEVRDINFDNFTLDSLFSNISYTLFHSKGGGLGSYASAKTTMIRYRTVCVIVDNGTEFPTKSSDWYYAMIRASFDDDNTLVEGSPEISESSTFYVSLTFRFPGFTSAQLGNTAYQALQGILNLKNNWELILRKQGIGKEKKLSPTTLSISTPVASAGDFGVAYFPITLGANFTGVGSGEYTLSAQFKKNDTGDSNSWLTVPEPFTITVQLTLGTATPEQSVIITNDGGVQISVTIQTESQA